MSDPGVLRHNLSIAQAFARSGVKGGAIPQFAGSVQPVMVMADFSESYSGVPIEARGFAGGVSPLTPGVERAVVLLRVIAAGGALVENLHAVAQGSDPSVWLDVSEQIPTMSVENPAAQIEVGGAPTTSDATEGYSTDAPSGVRSDFGGGLTGANPLQRLYVPSGAALILMSNLTGPSASIVWRLLWREIGAAIQGP